MLIKQLNITEIEEALKENLSISWHPEFVPEYWKDGYAPFYLTSIFKVPVKEKERQLYMIKYKCCKVDCKRCRSESYNGHFIIVDEKGYDEFDKVIFTETKKKTLITHHKHPVFILTVEKENKNVI